LKTAGIFARRVKPAEAPLRKLGGICI